MQTTLGLDIWIGVIVLSIHVCDVSVIQSLRDELEHYRRENENLKTHGPKNLPPAQSRVSWLYI